MSANPFQFYLDEKADHRMGLGKYAGERKYMSVRDNPTHENARWVNSQCDNVNLVSLEKSNTMGLHGSEKTRGGWCNHCNHFHWVMKAVRDIKPDEIVPVKVTKRINGVEAARASGHKVEEIVYANPRYNPDLVIFDSAMGIAANAKEFSYFVMDITNDVHHYRNTINGPMPVSFGTQAAIDDSKASTIREPQACWLDPDAASDCMSVGNTEPTRLNPGKHESNWTLLDAHSDPELDRPEPKPVKLTKKQLTAAEVAKKAAIRARLLALGVDYSND